MFPSAHPVRRRVLAVGAATLLILAALAVAAPLRTALAGVGSPPAPFDFGRLKGVGVQAAEGETIDHVAIWWDEVIDPGSLPAPADFGITINGSPVNATAVGIVYSGFAGFPDIAPLGATFMRIDLAQTWTAGDELLLSYTPGASPVRDLALNQAEPFTDLVATPWDWETLEPLIAVVDAAYGRDRILLMVSLPIHSGSIPEPDDFTVTADSTAVDAVSYTHLTLPTKRIV